MKKEIILKPVKASTKLFNKLEKLNLIKTMTPPKEIINTRTKTGAVSTFYKTQDVFGTHTLLCVGKRTTDIGFSYHDDNEDLILINPLNLKFKKMYLVVSYLKKDEFLKKYNDEKITNKDLLAIELEFNNPKLSFFTVLKQTVHCEVTQDKKGQHPIFFVAEPSMLVDNKISNDLYNFKIMENI